MSDPYISNVTLLAHSPGVSGSVYIKDTSPNPVGISGYGAAQLATGQTLTGGPCISVGGGTAGSFFQTPHQSFGTGDFTIEFFIFANSLTTTPAFVDNRVVTVPAYVIDLSIYNSSAALVTFYANGANRATSTSMSLATWTYFALSRVSGVTRFFMGLVGGTATQQGASYTDANNYTQQFIRFGANYLGNNSFNGYMAELRVTTGIGRYSANFPTPAVPFPDPSGSAALARGYPIG